MSDLSIVLKELEEKKRLWVTQPRRREDIDFSLSEEASLALRAYVFTEQPRIEYGLHRFVTEKLGDDIAHPDVIDPTIVLGTMCPMSDVPVTHEIDVRAEMGMDAFLDALRDPARTLDQDAEGKTRRIYCGFCEHNDGGSALPALHAASFSRVRYTASTSQIFLHAISRLEEMRGLYAKERELRGSTALAKQQIAAHLDMEYPSLHVDPSLATLTDADVDEKIAFFTESIRGLYAQARSFVTRVHRPLLAASVRVRKDPFKRIEESVMVGGRWNPVSVKAEVATLEDGDQSAIVDAYFQDIRSRFAADTEIESLGTQQDGRSSVIMLRYAGGDLPVTFRLKVLSHAMYVNDMLEHVRCPKLVQRGYDHELGMRMREAMLDTVRG